PDLLRRIRAPLIEKLIVDGSIETDSDEDRFRWTGNAATFERKQHNIIGENVEQLLLRTGAVGEAVEAAWGRKPSVRGHHGVAFMLPGDPVRVHRDGWHMTDGGGPTEHFNLWLPLTRLEHADGALAIAVGTHRAAERPAGAAPIRPLHLDIQGDDDLP